MKKILIVDDQDFIRKVLKKQLETIEGLEVIEASNGNVALGKAKVAMPVLILLDLIMPHKDGFETLKDLKENERTKDIPVIIITAAASKENVAIVKKLGVEKIIDKTDLGDTDFVSLVQKYL